jgi:hypothetical protein
MGMSLHCQQVENHVQTKFATPILYAIDILKIMIIFYIYITIDNIFCIFFENFNHLHFLVIFLVQ